MTVRVGFLGGGFIAHYHGKMLHTSGVDAELALVFDPDADKAAAFAAKSGATVAASVDEVLDGVDAVYVTTWTSEHRALVEAVVARGLPVFCEKPLATTVADTVAMIDAVEAAGVVNQVGLVLRDSPAFNFLRHLIRWPASGRLMNVVFRDDQFIPIQGHYASTWRADPTRAGAGTLIEHSIHDLDLLEWLCGPVVSAGARTAEFHDITGIEDLAVATLAFSSGALATLTSVWHDILDRPSLRRVEVFCENAYYVLEGDVDGPVRWTLDGDEGSLEGEALLARVAELGIEVRNPDAAFIEAVAAGTPAYPTFADALRAHVVAAALYRSAADPTNPGIPVPVPAGRPDPSWPAAPS